MMGMNVDQYKTTQINLPSGQDQLHKRAAQYTYLIPFIPTVVSFILFSWPQIHVWTGSIQKRTIVAKFQYYLTKGGVDNSPL